MKTLDKNIDNGDEIQKHVEIQNMQARLLSACLRNDLCLASTIGVDENGQYYMSYAVRFHGEQRDIFIDKARGADDSHFAFILRAVTGEIVSEVCPPAIPYITGMSSTDPSIGKLPVAYWKTRFSIDYDTTGTTVDGTVVDDTKGKMSWIGYNSSHWEIINVPFGTENPGYERIEKIQYVDLGPNGNVVAVMYKNDMLEEGQEPTLGQALQKAARLQFVSLLGKDTSFSLPPGETGIVSAEGERSFTIQGDVKIRDLAAMMGVTAEDVVEHLERYNLPANVGSYVSAKYAVICGKHFGFEIKYQGEQKGEEKVVDLPESINCHDLAKMLKTDLRIVVRILKDSDRFSATHQNMNRLLAADVAAKLGWEVKPIASAETDEKVIVLPEVISVKTLSEELKVQPRIVINILSEKGMFATINQALDRETATMVALNLGWRVESKAAVVIPESIRIDDLATLLSVPVISVLAVLSKMCVPGIKTSNVSRVLDDNMAEQAAMALGFEVSKPEQTPVEKARQAVSDEVAKLKAQAAKKKGDLTKLVGRRRVLYAAEYAELDDALKAHYRQLLAEFGKKALNGMSEGGELMVTAGNYCHRILDSEFLRKEWEEAESFSGPKPTLDYFIVQVLGWGDRLFFALRGAKVPKYVKVPAKKSGVTPVEGSKAATKVAIKKPSSRKPTVKKENGESSIE